MSYIEDNILELAMRETDLPQEGAVAITFAIVNRTNQTDEEKDRVEQLLEEAVKQVIEPLEQATSLHISVEIEYAYFNGNSHKCEKIRNNGKARADSGITAILVNISGNAQEEMERLRQQLSAIKFTLSHELFHLTDHAEEESKLSEHLADALSAVLLGKTEALKGFSKLFPDAQKQSAHDVERQRQRDEHPANKDRLQALNISQYETRIKGLLSQIQTDAKSGATTSWRESLQNKELGEYYPPSNRYQK